MPFRDSGLFGYGRALDVAGDDPEMYAQFQADRNRQMIANMLLQQGMQQPQGQMVGRFYVPPSPLQHVGSLANMAAGFGMMNYGDMKRSEMAKAIGERQRKEVEDFKKSIAPQERQATFKDIDVYGFPVTKAEMPDTFDPYELQGGPTVGFQPAPNVNQLNAPVPSQTRQHQVTPPTPAPGTDIPIRDRYGAEPATQDIPGMTMQVPRSRDEVKMAYFDAMTRNNPRLKEAVKFMAQQEEMASQKELDREVRREGIEANVLTRLAMMQNTLATKEMDYAYKLSRGIADDTLKREIEGMRGDLQRETAKLQAESRKETAQIAADSRVDAAKIAAGNKQESAELKRQDKANEAKTSVDMALNTLSNTRNVANELLNHPGLGRITGIIGMMPNFPGSDASNAQAVLDQLKAQASVQMINDMRQASKTGGAVGQVTEREWVYLQNAAARLSQTQGTPAFKDALKDYIKQLDRVEGLINKAYQRQFGGEQQPAADETATSSNGWSIRKID